MSTEIEIISSDQYETLYINNFTPVIQSKLKTVAKKFENVIVPFLISDSIKEEFKEYLIEYFYVKCTSSTHDEIQEILKEFPKNQISEVGRCTGEDILASLNLFKEKTQSEVEIGEHYRITKGPFTNLVGKAVEVDGDRIKLEHTTVGEKEPLVFDLTVSEVAYEKNFLLSHSALNLRDLVKQTQDKGERKALVIDLHTILMKSMLSDHFGKIYNREEAFVGGSLGAYFNILNLKIRYPEYEVYLVSDYYAKEKIGKKYPNSKIEIKNKKKFWEAYSMNEEWVIEFCKACGFTTVRFKGVDGVDASASLAVHMEKEENFSKVTLFTESKNVISVVSNVIEVLCPKDSQRSHSKNMTYEKLLSFYGVPTLYKLNWVRSLIGDDFFLTSVNEFNTNISKKSNFKKCVFSDMANRCSTLEEFIAELKKNDNLKEFIESGQFSRNFNNMKIRTNLISSHLSFGDNYSGAFNRGRVIELMENNHFIKELEQFEKNEKILQGLWYV